MENISFECLYDNVITNQMTSIEKKINFENVSEIIPIIKSNDLFTESLFRSFSISKVPINKKKEGISFTYNIKKDMDLLSNKIFSELNKNKSRHTINFKATEKIFLLSVLCMTSPENMYLLEKLDIVILRSGSDKSSISFITMDKEINVKLFEKIIITTFKFPTTSYFTKKNCDVFFN